MTVEELNNHNIAPNDTQLNNLKDLALKISELENLFGKPFTVTSGLRDKALQNKINPNVSNSAHLAGQAVDLLDVTGELWVFLMDHIDVLIKLGLYLESRTYTPRWCHLQSRVPRSQNRIFIP